MQLQGGISDAEERKQREICASKHGRRDEMNKGKLSEMEIEREEECGICMELSSKVVLPNCSHSLCMKCYKNWYVNFLNKICSYMEKKIRTIHYLCLVVYSRDHWVVDRVVDEKLFKEQEMNFRPSWFRIVNFSFLHNPTHERRTMVFIITAMLYITTCRLDMLCQAMFFICSHGFVLLVICNWLKCR